MIQSRRWFLGSMAAGGAAVGALAGFGCGRTGSAPESAAGSAPASVSPDWARGIDVSHWDGEIDWSQVKQSGMQFAFAKAVDRTEENEVDPRFAANWQGMKSAEITRGAYLFFHAGSDAGEQAEEFARTVGSLQEDDVPPMLDVEEGGVKGVDPAAVLAGVTECLEKLESLCGKKPILYTDEDTLRDYLNSTTSLTSYPLWQAQFQETPPAPLGSWPHWVFWQYSDSGKVNGVSGSVDLDYFQGSAEELTRFIADPGGWRP